MQTGNRSRYTEELLAQSEALRAAIRRGDHTGDTSGLAPGFLQGNVVILPADWASDFLVYCQNNPTPCPLLAVSEPGDPSLTNLGPDLDIRTDVPEYQVFRDGERAETEADILDLWRDDLVTFVLGCSFSFEEAIQRVGLSIRNIELGRNVSMFKTSIPTQPGGRFFGGTVVTMRPFVARDAIRAIQVTTRLPKAHGAPIHIGDPELIGIADLSKPDFGDPVPVEPNELPVFWGCGVTPQLALQNAKPPLAITHVPGKMLITKLLNDQLSVL